jgi:hypothetical protein
MDNSAASDILDIYSLDLDAAPGQMLGISFVRSQQENLSVCVNNAIIQFEQFNGGIIGISGVVWDCGLFLVDYIVFLFCNDHNFGSSTLDIGCGTGIVGIAFLELVRNKVQNLNMIFTDKILSDIFKGNLSGCVSQYDPQKLNCTTIPYDWLEKTPDILLDTHYSTIFCSDILYEPKVHSSLIHLFKLLHFDTIIISYKRRKDREEKYFFEQLSLEFDLCLISPGSFPLVNLSISETKGLYIITVRRRMPS